MAILFIRTVLLYLLLLLLMKAMGKRQLGQLQPIELVAVLVISEMASLAMQSSATPMLYSLTPLITITLLQILLSMINLKSEKVRAAVCGRPEIVIEKGHLKEDIMRKLRLNLNDIQELCRNKGYFDLTQVEYAIMETNGSLSVMPRVENRPLEVGDMLPDPPQEQLSLLLILDGHVNQQTLHALGYNELWLQKQLRKMQVSNPAEIFVDGIDETGSFFAQKRQEPRHEG